MLSKAQKGYIIVLTPFFLGFVFGLLVGSCGKENKDTIPREENAPVEEVTFEGAAEGLSETVADDISDNDPKPAREIIYNRKRLKYRKLFADANDKHLEVAVKIGRSSPHKTRNNFSPGPDLVEVKDCNWYVVDNLRYSVPYLTRGAKRGLDIIGKAFCDSLKSKKLLDYKLVVSSILRTEEDVKRLRRSGNPNASENSAHCYGTTFDITYTRYFRENETDEFMQPFELTKVLGEVLLDQKEAGNCLVKYEYKEHCFHITSTLVR